MLKARTFGLGHGSGVSRLFAKVYQPKKDFGPTYHEWNQYKEITARARKDNSNLYIRKQGELDLEEVCKP